MQTKSLLLLCTLLPITAFAADTPPAEDIQPADNNTWIDQQHGGIKNTLNRWSHGIDGWFGETDPDKPASANLRIMLDTEWNKYDEFSVTPRIRGRLKLPVLQQKLNVVFGDDSLDNDFQNDVSGYRNRVYENGKTFDASASRDNNASVALRWSDLWQRQAVETDFDIGIRSGNDLYARAKVSKDWALSDTVSTRLEQIYRYGLDSKHHVRTNWESRYAPTDQAFIANQFHVQYEHDKQEDWTWGNSLYRQHELGKHRHVNYGVHVSGHIENKKADINSYGPFVGYRQPIWRDWLFAQTEVNYLNDRKAQRNHHIGSLLRIEALF